MTRLSRRRFLQALTAVPLAPSVALAERRVVAAEQFDVTHVDVSLLSLDDAHDGLIVAQLSDIHLGQFVPRGRVEAAVRAINQVKPDLVVLTGDFVTTKRDPVSLVAEVLAPLEGPRVAVLGNHDHWSHPEGVTFGLEQVGISVLRNQHTALRLRGVDFTVVGIDDSTSKHDDVARAFRGTGPGSRLVLTHTPSCAGHLPTYEDLLCLSGHTHGGQWEIPGLTAAIYKGAGQPWYRGSYSVRGNQLYVNRGLGFGLGTTGPRINSAPELTVFTLRRREA
jgi:hypothetical protein